MLIVKFDFIVLQRLTAEALACRHPFPQGLVCLLYQWSWLACRRFVPRGPSNIGYPRLQSESCAWQRHRSCRRTRLHHPLPRPLLSRFRRPRRIPFDFVCLEPLPRLRIPHPECLCFLDWIRHHPSFLGRLVADRLRRQTQTRRRLVDRSTSHYCCSEGSSCDSKTKGLSRHRYLDRATQDRCQSHCLQLNHWAD